MNFKEIDNCINVVRFIAKKGVLLILKKDASFLRKNIDNFKSEWEIKLNDLFYDIDLYENIIIIRYGNSNIDFLSLEEGKVLHKDSKENLRFNSFTSLTDSLITFTTQESILDNDWKFGIYDFDKEEILWIRHNAEVGFSIKYKHLLLNTGNPIIRYDIDRGSIIWKSKILEIDKAINIIGIINEEVWLAWSKKEGHWLKNGLLALSLRDGSILKNFPWDRRFYGYTAAFSPSQNSIISLRGGRHEPTYFLEIDLATSQITREAKLDQLAEMGLAVYEFTFQGEHIYFNAHYNNSFGAEAIGILDYHTLELLWWTHVSLEAGAFFGAGQKPTVDGNRIYILDSKDTLHIFQKDE